MSNTDTIRTFFTNNPGREFTASHIASNTGLTTKQASDVLRRLVKNGEVLKTDNGFKSAEVEYYDTDEEISGPTAPDQGQADRSGPSARETGTSDDFETSPAGEPMVDEVGPVEDEPEVVYYESIDFPGNYSIAFVPFALGIAEAAGVPAKSENLKGSLTRRVHLGGDDMDRAKAVLDFIKQEAKDALEHLATWQKEHRAERKGLTDMEKYLQHREQITNYGERSAKRVKKHLASI